jgi:23S rRNA (adenine2503-C2)-methyltransferase
MNCSFCYTGRMGLLHNLSTAQIVEQLVEARRYLAAEGASAAATNVVFMGMGALVAALPCCAAAVAYWRMAL